VQKTKSNGLLKVAQARNDDKEMETGSNVKAIGNGKTEKHISEAPPSTPLQHPTFRRREVTPAYAYKNAETGLLEITTVRPPNPSHIATDASRVVRSDGQNSESAGNGVSKADECNNTEVNNTTTTATPALYPIAVNGGGVGLYRDPRQYGTNAVGLASASANLRTGASRRAPLRSYVSFPLLEEEGIQEKKRKKIMKQCKSK